MEETDIAVGELVNRLGECTKDHVSAMRLSGAIQETSSQHGHEVASEAVGRYIAEAKNRAIKNPVRYFEGIVQQVITEGK